MHHRELLIGLLPLMGELPFAHDEVGGESACLVARGGVPGCGQAHLQVADGLARRPLPQQGLEAATYRNSASSWVS